MADSQLSRDAMQYATANTDAESVDRFKHLATVILSRCWNFFLKSQICCIIGTGTSKSFGCASTGELAASIRMRKMGSLGRAEGGAGRARDTVQSV